MKTRFVSPILILALMITACSPIQTITSTPHGDPLALAATTTPEIFIGLTQVVPVQVQLNGITLAVQEAYVGECDLPDCLPAPAGTRYLRVTLQALNLPADQSLDYKNLPQGIAIHDDTGTLTPFNRLIKYSPATQQLILYFTVPESANVFGLQWPAVAEIPLTVTISEGQAFAGLTTTYGKLTIVVPPGVANGASGSEYPRLDGIDAAWWQLTPGHTEINLNDYYVLQGKSHQPQIIVYPAQGYAELVPVAFESMHRLNNILYDPSALISTEQLPAVPFFNAVQVFATNIQRISFQNGKGVRFLTEYAQYAASANNNDLFYEFQGLTSDGAYYIVAILPITMPMLAETSDGSAPLPPGGIPYTYFTEGSNADMKGYYADVTALLNGTSPESFVPTISQLDALIESMRITP